MNFKKFWKETFAGFVVKNVLLAIVAFILLSWVTLICIDFYTHHGEAEIIPDLRGAYVEEAEILLSKKNLYPKVIDSVYIRDKKLGTIVEQIPPPNSTIKRNRPVYLIINSRQVKQIPLPNVIDVSYRQAIAMLSSVGLSVEGVQYLPSEYKDLVLDVKYKESSLLPGTRIPEGSSVILVVGSNGYGDSLSVVPQLKGLTLQEAKEKAFLNSFVIGSTLYDILPNGNDNDYFIYRQRPSAGELANVGSRIDVWLTTSKKRLKETFDENDNSLDSNGEDEIFF